MYQQSKTKENIQLSCHLDRLVEISHQTKSSCLSGSQYLLNILESYGIQHFFMVPGKLINPIMSCFQVEAQRKIMPIVAAHEAGAAYMADGYAKASGKFGVCVTISGPGTTNVVTPIAAAYIDQSPVLVISGQISSQYEMQGALQDATQSGFNQVDVMRPITKAAYEVKDPKLVSRYLNSAIKSMYGEEIGPAYLGLTKNVLTQEVSDLPDKTRENKLRPKFCDQLSVSHMMKHILFSCKKIAIIIGSRSNPDFCLEPLKKLSENFNVPVATTLSAKGYFPEQHPNSLGVFGYAGHRRAIEVILQDCDAVILLGFDATQWNTLGWHPDFIGNKIVVQVDRSMAYIGKQLSVDYEVVSEESAFLQELLMYHYDVFFKHAAARSFWLYELRKIPRHYEPELADLEKDALHPAIVVRALRRLSPENTVALVDAGNHRAFAAHYWDSSNHRGYLQSAGIAPMGWSVPASIGAKLARPEDPCLVMVGDGCMLMHGQEIQTAVRHELDITFVVMNNSCYGATYFNNVNNLERLSRLPQHDWVKFAESLGMKAFRATTELELVNVYLQAKKVSGPKLIDVIISHDIKSPAEIYRQQVKKWEGL